MSIRAVKDNIGYIVDAQDTFWFSVSFSPHISLAKIACEICAFAAILCGKSFDAVLAHLAQDSPSTRRKANPEQAPVSGRVEAF